ncbi:triose-phosphate isomerase [Pontibaca methylaminivorans]|uniref:Triosephosphate isomerase n=1 Tax=Pontibaca methylaminivorans TaxID=515897 RepID=A0A1R3WE97_9RHOB|nr:triose-phosphate isomerase [Pontibaca methylaminivorans]SIT76265.1 triosephosphate isomerase [Pontibaca methylaminivorans]
MRRKLAAGNWKMHGTGADLAEIATLARTHADPACEVLICPPATLIERAAREVRGSALMIGAQDCHSAPQGAHTGDISAAMIRDAGAGHVILGHSERRQDHAETSAVVHAKATAALHAGLITIICLGETLADRERGATLDVIGQQLAGSTPDAARGENTVIAYEPVWAIGSGHVAHPDQIAEVHGFLRERLAHRFGTGVAAMIRLLYGGSVKPANAAGIFAIPDVDGALVGGASLRAESFSPVISALEQAAA